LQHLFVFNIRLTVANVKHYMTAVRDGMFISKFIQRFDTAGFRGWKGHAGCCERKNINYNEWMHNIKCILEKNGISGSSRNPEEALPLLRQEDNAALIYGWPHGFEKDTHHRRR
jgi:hypothetical protein